MIRNIFIMRDNGVCLYFLPCSNVNLQKNDIETDFNYSQLISGFFMAIDTFAQSVAGYNQYLKSISLREINFYFLRAKSFYYVLETDNINHNMDIDDYISILEDISDEFEKKSYIMDDEIIEIIKDEKLDQEIHSKIARATRKSLFKNIETSHSAYSNQNHISP